MLVSKSIQVRSCTRCGVEFPPTSLHLRVWVGNKYKNYCVKCLVEAILELPDGYEQINKALVDIAQTKA